MRKLTVVIADDHPEVRSALRLMLEEQSGIQVAGEAAGISELLEQVRQFNPDMLLLDWDIAGAQAKRLIGSLRKICPALYIIALDSSSARRQNAIAAGADDFASKNDNPENLISVVNRFQQNRRSA